MTIDFYYMDISAPCRTVRMVAKLLGVDLNLKHTDIFNQEQFTPEFIKLNPLHAVPVLVDNGFVLTESQAIVCYLADKYGKDDSLYPKDLQKRAVVNQLLFFDSSTIYPRMPAFFSPIIWYGHKPDLAKLEKLYEAYEFFDKILEGKKWAAGEQFTIADCTLLSTVSSAESLGVNMSKYPNVSRWLAQAKKEIPNYDELNHVGCLDCKNRLHARLKEFKYDNFDLSSLSIKKD